MPEPEFNANRRLVIALLVIGGIIALAVMTSRDASKLGPSKDPYYDAPTGQTRGGDTY